jgi:hypothetical protein
MPPFEKYKWGGISFQLVSAINILWAAYEPLTLAVCIGVPFTMLVFLTREGSKGKPKKK